LPALGSMASGKLTPAKRERELWPPAENGEEFQYVFTGNEEAPQGVNADSVKKLQGRRVKTLCKEVDGRRLAVSLLGGPQGDNATNFVRSAISWCFKNPLPKPGSKLEGKEQMPMARFFSRAHVPLPPSGLFHTACIRLSHVHVVIGFRVC
jgi:hypothetical protein